MLLFNVEDYRKMQNLFKNLFYTEINVSFVCELYWTLHELPQVRKKQKKYLGKAKIKMHEIKGI